jgi:hypothetical protein
MIIHTLETRDYIGVDVMKEYLDCDLSAGTGD